MHLGLTLSAHIVEGPGRDRARHRLGLPIQRWSDDPCRSSRHARLLMQRSDDRVGRVVAYQALRGWVHVAENVETGQIHHGFHADEECARRNIHRTSGGCTRRELIGPVMYGDVHRTMELRMCPCCDGRGTAVAEIARRRGDQSAGSLLDRGARDRPPGSGTRAGPRMGRGLESSQGQSCEDVATRGGSSARRQRPSGETIEAMVHIGNSARRSCLQDRAAKQHT